MKSQIKTVVSLTVICAVVAVLLAVTNYITAPIIKKNEAAQVNGALSVVLPSGEGFEAVDISKYELPETITEVYSEKNGGYVFKMLTSGYGSDFVLMCGIDANGAVAGATCISSNETLGAEKEYGKTLVGATGETIDGVATVSGATRTTDAYKNAVRDALNAKIILGGGSVDLRDEAQILADNLNEALPAGEGKFTPVFITEILEGVQEVYKAENGAGYVLKSGENFIAATADGTVVSEVADDVKTLMSDNAKKLISSKLTQIDISGYA
ncbi:MAG: FMN-binding protein, partial [Acutalibacteraceae bacterium]|nr:FMN-binding protein [Acutalibacteraceae bacterium]